MGFDPFKRLSKMTSHLAGNFGTINQQLARPSVPTLACRPSNFFRSAQAKPPLIAACQLIPHELRNNDAGRINWQLDQLPRALKQGGFKGKRVVCAIPASQMYVRHLQLPKETQTTPPPSLPARSPPNSSAIPMPSRFAMSSCSDRQHRKN